MNKEIQERFWEALLNKDVETARQMIAAGADVNERMESFCNGKAEFPIFCIDDEHDAEMLQVLIAAGVNVNQEDCEGNTLLLKCDQAATELVKTLVQAGAQVNVRDQEGNTPLIFAALLDAPESVRVLLEAGAHVNVLGKVERETPYDIAKGEVALGAGGPAHECVGLLAEAGNISPLAIDIEEHPALSPLNREFLEAVQHLDLDRAAAALAAGADVNATDRYGVSALAQAVVADDAEFCRFLLEQGLAPEHIRPALDWLYASVGHGHIEPAEELLAYLHGEALRQAQEKVLLDAVRCGSTKIVRRMLERGTNPDCVDEDSNSALMIAVRTWENSAEITQLLLEAGADVNYANNRGVTAVLLATIDQELDVMKILLLHGADYHRKDNVGYSAYSRSRGNTAVAKAFDETLASMEKE